MGGVKLDQHVRLLALDAPAVNALDGELRRLVTQLDRTRAELHHEEMSRQRLDLSIDRIVRLRAFLRGLARLEEAEASAPEMVDLGAAFRAVVDRHRAEILETEAVIIEDELPPVWATPAEVDLLLDELIDNALRYRSEHPVVSITARQDGPWQVVEVADNGPGFDPSYAETIFEPLATLEGAGVPGGLGLGLSMCRRIAQRYGGSIDVSSAPRRGTTFSVRLPAGPPAVTDSE